MNFNAPLLKPIRILLFPVSLVYAFGVWFRNKLFDVSILPSSSFNLPVIGVGNLAAGGTGKSTMVEWLVGILKQQFKVAVLSRGYKRKTRGYALAGEKSTALEIGDEPMLFHIKFPDVTIAVGEERVVAIPQILHDRPNTQLIIMDDAFQHRTVKAGLNILLTECSNLFTRDWFLPTGDLRDETRSYKRADVIVVTKCPQDLSENEKASITREIDPMPHQQIIFTTIQYGQPYHIMNKDKTILDEGTEALLVSGIANPEPLKKYLVDQCATYYAMLYGDHHIFTIDDWKEIVKRFQSIQADKKIIITTEKDAVRLVKFVNELKDFPVFVIPIQMKFLFGDERRFTDIIIKFITEFRLKS